MPWSSMVRGCGILMAGAALFAVGACTPSGSMSECSSGIPCERGEVCNLQTLSCEPTEATNDNTGTHAGGNFSERLLPFFRGRACVATKVAPGDPIPVSIEPCIHPCIEASQFQFYNRFSCDGSGCRAAEIAWLEDAVGTDCPNDVFGKFAAAECTYPFKIEGLQSPISPSGTDYTGTVPIEVPFLTNEDIKVVAAKDMSTSEFFGLIDSYPPETDRIFQVNIANGNPSAPESCADAACTCREIGF